MHTTSRLWSLKLKRVLRAGWLTRFLICTVFMCTAPGAIRRPTAWRLAAAGVTLLTTALAGVPAAAAGRISVAAMATAHVPWRHAGPGWAAVQYSTASTSGAPKGATTFYLVSPAGRKYPFYRTPATSYPSLSLIDWSGDRRRIFVQQNAVGNPRRLTYEQISLVTGAVVNRFSLSSDVLPAQYTEPRGDGFLAEGSNNHPWDYRYDMTGHLQATLARGTFLNWLLDASDGSFILAGTFRGIDLISKAGHVTRRIRIPVTRPASRHVCGPVRWWSRTTLLADCFDLAPYNADRLWLVPMRGGPPRPLTPALRAHGLFQGYFDAWRLPSGLYLQADDAHDTLSIVRQSRDGAEHTIHIPGPAGVSDFIDTALGSRLLIDTGSGVSNTSSLFWYNPATRAIHYVFRTPPQIRGVYGVVTFGSQGNG
jgi:TolB protein